MINRILRNTWYLTCANVIEKSLFYLLMIVMGRIYGAEGLGVYSFVLAFTGTVLLSAYVDKSIAMIIIRELAEKKDNIVANKYLWNFIALKFVLAIMFYPLLFIASQIFPVSEAAKPLIYIFGIAYMIESIAVPPYVIMCAFQKFGYYSFGKILKAAVIVIFSIFFILNAYGMKFVFFSYVIGVAVSGIYAYIVLSKWFFRPSFHSLDFKLWWNWLKSGFYFLVQNASEVGYSNLSVLILSASLSNYHIGLYYIAYKIKEAIMKLYDGFLASVYPFYSSNRCEANVIKKKFGECRNYSLIFGIIVSFLLIVFSKFIVGLFFGPEFEASVFLLQIFGIELVFVILRRNITVLLNAIGKEKINAIFFLFVFSFNFILSIILVLSVGLKGIVFANLISSILHFALSSYILSKYRKDTKKH